MTPRGSAEQPSRGSDGTKSLRCSLKAELGQGTGDRGRGTGDRGQGRGEKSKSVCVCVFVRAHQGCGETDSQQGCEEPVKGGRLSRAQTPPFPASLLSLIPTPSQEVQARPGARKPPPNQSLGSHTHRDMQGHRDVNEPRRTSPPPPPPHSTSARQHVKNKIPRVGRPVNAALVSAAAASQ